MELTRSQKFIQENKYVLDAGRDFFNPHIELMDKYLFHKRDLKILLIFPSPSDVKAVSSTKEAINDFIIEKVPYAFIDFAYMPNQKDVKLYDKHNMPYAIGNITHLDPSHFDVVGFSISVLCEIVAAPQMISTFNRCDKPIPMTWSERKDMPVGSVPHLTAGGITASYSDIAFGYLPDGRQAFIDCVYMGSCDAQEPQYRAFKDAKLYNAGLTTSEEQPAKFKTIQGTIDELFAIMPMLYQPQAYEVKFDKDMRVISNKKIKPKAQDFVVPNYPHSLEHETLGIGRKIINADGEQAGKSQTQLSEGCAAAGACSFCAEGNFCG